MVKESRIFFIFSFLLNNKECKEEACKKFGRELVVSKSFEEHLEKAFEAEKYSSVNVIYAS